MAPVSQRTGVMLDFADDIAGLSPALQRAFALSVVERLLIARSRFPVGNESDAVAGLFSIVDELWEKTTRDEELTADEQDAMRFDINAIRPHDHSDDPAFRLRNICWILKSVLNVYRDRDHAFEIARLGAEMAHCSTLDEATEVRNQRQFLNRLQSLGELHASNLDAFREYLRTLPLLTRPDSRANQED